MVFELIEKIYVINLKSCVDRKEHIIKEFKNSDINEYEFFEAISKDSKQVSEMMASDFVCKFPPCFRCHKNRCNHRNNVLVNAQIGNWCSYIKLMNEIVEKNYKGLIMICEDDIKFTDNGVENIQTVFSTKFFEKHKIQMNEPILIKVGSALGKFHDLNCKTRLRIKKVELMSNPCFVINTLFAHSFIKNLKKIGTTSDGYIHANLPNNLDTSIKTFTIIPQPVYELSCGMFREFKSEIHPKGIDQEDKIRQQNHVKRIDYDTYLKNLKK